MKDAKRSAMISALPERAARASIRPHVLHEREKGNLANAAKAFDEMWQCVRHEAIKVELAEFLIARFALRGDRKRAANFLRALCLAGRLRGNLERVCSGPAYPCLYGHGDETERCHLPLE